VFIALTFLEAKPSPDDESALVARCQQGDERAFEELVRKHQQTVFNLIYHNIGNRVDVEDVAQKVFTKVYLSLPKFDNRRPFFPWLYRIAVNQCYDELRRLRRRKLLTFTDLNLEDTDAIEKLINRPENQPAPPEDRQELYALLHKMLDQLPEQQRTAIVLRDLESIPYDKMSEMLGCTEQAARLKVFRARMRLKELMEKALRRQDRDRPRHALETKSLK
jgi:RNA polymerase sigma-70 factor, ECF subfamily